MNSGTASGIKDARTSVGLLAEVKDRGDTPMLRSIIDAFPALLFVVDKDVNVVDFNAAAAEFLSSSPASPAGGRAGKLLHCIHSRDVAAGCGFGPYCKACVIRNSVALAFSGEKIVRRRTTVELFQEVENIEVFCLITASSFEYGERSLVLLVIEDISEIAELRRIIPICSVCRKVRDEKEAWHRVEAYFRKHWDVNFSHSLCPECLENEIKKIDEGL